MTYSCDLCEKLFSDKSNLYRHKRMVHSGKRFVCQSCNKSFTRAGKLRKHKCIISMREKEAQESPQKRLRMEEIDDRAKQTKIERNEDAKNEFNFMNLNLNDSPMELDFSTEKPDHDKLTNFSKSQQSKQSNNQMISKNYGDITDRYWRSMKDFLKEGPIQDIFHFYIYDDLALLKKDFFDMF